MIELIVGLGNPGARYEKTRHNVGFWFLDSLNSGGWKKQPGFNGVVGSYLASPKSILLLKPDTFMNRSGLAVVKVVNYYQIPPENVLVVHDELDLLPGNVRLKSGGGHSGHNGLRDIISHLGSNAFLRLRFGIGRPLHSMEVSNYVLSEPSKSEKSLIDHAVDKVLNNMSLIISENIQVAMNNINVSS